MDSKICNVLRQFLKDGSDGAIRELPVHVVYYALSYVIKENGIAARDRELLVEQMRQVFPLDTCPIILVPLLHNTSVYRAR